MLDKTCRTMTIFENCFVSRHDDLAFLFKDVVFKAAPNGIRYSFQGVLAAVAWPYSDSDVDDRVLFILCKGCSAS